MADVKVTVEDAALAAAIRRIQEALFPTSLESFLRGPVDTFLKERASKRFGKHGDEAVGTWAALSAYTVADRLQHGWPGGPPNFRSGELHDWIVSSGGDTELTGDGVSLKFPGQGGGIDEAKLSVAQKGLDPNPIAGFSPVPARPVVALSQVDNSEITILFGAWLHERLSSGVGL